MIIFRRTLTRQNTFRQFYESTAHTKPRTNHHSIQRANFRQPPKPENVAAESRPENQTDFHQLAGKINFPENSKNKRLAYTMRETAEILGVSYITVHRLIKRGLLKNSQALRNKIIPATEIERFLKETL
ncbi:MAG TPA: helix-turn-helix domain-containing protein [Candidatus Aquilonibacter sp.]|nr:helix-turn-helix domain-containing protein [Candidatus Aquilonibacter sp.]